MNSTPKVGASKSSEQPAMASSAAEGPAHTTHTRTGRLSWGLSIAWLAPLSAIGEAEGDTGDTLDAG